MEGKRMKILRVSAEVILQLLKPEKHCYESFKNPLPKDCRVTGVWVDYKYSEEIMLRIESEIFSLIKEGMILPHLDHLPSFRRMIEIDIDIKEKLEQIKIDIQPGSYLNPFKGKEYIEFLLKELERFQE